MNVFSSSGLLIGILFAALGTLTLVKAKKSIHYIWACFSICVALWGFGSYQIGIDMDPASALQWWRIAYVGVILIPVFFTNFIIAFLELKRKWLMISLYALSAVFLLADFYGGSFIREVVFSFGQFYYLTSPPPSYTAFIISFLGMIVYSHAELLKAYKESRGIKRIQIRYFLYAAVPSFVGGALEFLPVYGIRLYPYLHIAIALSSLTVTYAIFRYRLMDIRIVIRKTLIYFAAAAFSYGIFFAIAWAFERYFGGIFTSAAYLFGSILAPLFVIFLLRLYALIQKTTDKYLFADLYAHQQAMIRLTDELTRSIDLGQIVNLIVNDIKGAMKLDRAGVLIREERGSRVKYGIAKAVGFKRGEGIEALDEDSIVRYLEKTRKPLVVEEISLASKNSDDSKKKKQLDELAKSLRDVGVSLCLPMAISGKLIGMIALGNKISGDAYTSEDLSLLVTLSQQASIAVDNARLYKQVQDFNSTLEQKVAEQTKEIRGQKEQLEKALVMEKRAHELEKRANEELRELDESKSEFMTITQHHLRTPLSINAGIIDILLSDGLGKLPKKMRAMVSRLQESNQKEIDVVNELLNVSSYQIGKEIIDLEKKVDFPELMEETLKDLRVAAEKKGIMLKYAQDGAIPKIFGDRTKLKLVFTNVIDNCIKYTAKGGVTVRVKAKRGKLAVSISDTGIGLSDEVKENLFKRTFQRGEKAKRMFVEGKGLGLYLSGKIVEGHHGKIWAESRGEGKGSVFHIELPIKQANAAVHAPQAE